MKNKNNPNYLATINPKHRWLPPGQFSKNSIRKNARNQNPKLIDEKQQIYQFSNGATYQRLGNGQMIRLERVQKEQEVKNVV